MRTLLESPGEQWSRISDQVKAIKSEYNLKTVLGARRTSFSNLPEIDIDLSQSFHPKRTNNCRYVGKRLDQSTERS